MADENQNPTYKPCGWYYRTAIRRATNLDELRNLALTLLDELEDHRLAFREIGVWPPVKNDPGEVTAPLLNPEGRESSADTDAP